MFKVFYISAVLAVSVHLCTTGANFIENHNQAKTELYNSIK